ncbi:hypothetical protein [Faecalibaculum rodentium]|uniref:hypothetical protein n=1 Tax=Faecalibaculum rodentium TaxID=1702221 RepID=UPI001F581ED9|nr:hypothetical protein [Faecalibaculum rodentium]
MKEASFRGLGLAFDGIKLREVIGMSVVNTIEKAIQELDPATFQQLCDQYLKKKYKYRQYTAYGKKEGVAKTTKGTPDTYFITEEEKFVFAEYTMQTTNNLEKKLMDDIGKCLDVAQSDVFSGELEKIVFCYSSSNLSPIAYSHAHELCKASGVSLEIISINALASDIYDEFLALADEFLYIHIRDIQVLSIEEFTEEAEKRTNTSNPSFLFREEELKQIETEFAKSDMVLMVGNHGIGKTRLALEYIT